MKPSALAETRLPDLESGGWVSRALQQAQGQGAAGGHFAHDSPSPFQEPIQSQHPHDAPFGAEGNSPERYSNALHQQPQQHVAPYHFNIG